MIYHYPEDHFKYINCTMARFTQTNMLGAMSECASLYPQLNSDKMIDCANGPAGTQLLLSMGLYSKIRQKDLNWVPWIVINDVHTKDMQTNAENDLVTYLCQNFYESLDRCAI